MAALIHPRRRAVVLLGATGSIGRQVCDVIERYAERFRLVAIAAHSSTVALQEIAAKHDVSDVAIATPASDVPSSWTVGEEAICQLARRQADVVCIAIPGAAALNPTLAAIESGQAIATATKEVLVMAGEIVLAAAAEHGAKILPIDSEHSAIWQCLRGEEPGSVARLVLTGSGGPFRTRPLSSFGEITLEEALRHPTWNMGPKITIDSATMMNKALEIIEAHHLFNIEYARIEVVIHPSSIVHSYVEFIDGATKAQLGIPDMRLPIALALADGERLPGVAPAVELPSAADLHFEAVDNARYPAIALGKQVGVRGGVAPAVMNAANEVAVELFSQGLLRFDEIVAQVAECLTAITGPAQPQLADVVRADLDARDWMRNRIADREPLQGR